MRHGIGHRQTPTKNQLDRPTCVAFAVTALHEYECDCTSGGKIIASLDLSEEFLYHHSKAMDGLPKSVSGTTIEAAAASLRDYGQSLESLCPYRTGTMSASPLVLTTEAMADAKARTLGRLCPRPVSFKSIEESLRSHIPAVAVFDWYSNSYVAPLGRIGLPAATDRLLGRHAVLIVEIDDESNPGNCLLGFKGSWGSKWGNNGFGSLGADYFGLYARAVWSPNT